MSKRVKDKSKKRKVKEESEEEEAMEIEEEEEEEDEENEYNKDGFVVDDEEEEEGSNNLAKYRRDQVAKIRKKEDNFENSVEEVESSEGDAELSASDIEVFEERKPKKGKRKLMRKNKEEEEPPKEKKIRKVPKQREAHEEKESSEKEESHFEVRKDEVIGGEPALKEEEIPEQNKPNDSKSKVRFMQIPSKYKNMYTSHQLKEIFASPEDYEIKLTDCPERILLRYKGMDLNTIGDGIEMEAEWLCQQSPFKDYNKDKQLEIKGKIISILNLYKKDFFDCPYIVTYKKHLYSPDLKEDDVWRLFYLDDEWLKLNECRKSIEKQYYDLMEVIRRDQELDDNFINLKLKYIDNAHSVTELNYTQKYLEFIKEKNFDEFKDIFLEQQRSQGQIAPLKNSYVKRCVELKYPEIISNFVLSPFDLVSNLELLEEGNVSNYKIPSTPELVPAKFFEEYKNKIFPNQEIEHTYFLKECCNYASLELSNHPYIKKYVFKFFKENSVLSTLPTEKGKEALDVFNPSYRTKRIENRPISEFYNSQEVKDLFFDIYQCEKRGLIKVDISLENEETNLKALNDKLLKAYSPVDNKSWSIARHEIIDALIEKYLLKEFQTEIRNELYKISEEYIINACANKFGDLLFTGPYRKVHKEEENEDEEDDLLFGYSDSQLPKVMSFVYDSDKKHTYCTVVSKHGEVQEYQIFKTLINKPVKFLKDSEKTVFDKELKEAKSLIAKYKPDFIVIGANDLKCDTLKKQLQNEPKPGEVNERNEERQEEDFWISFGDLSIPIIFANSMYSEDAFPNYDKFLKEAISLARYQQNPLEEILQLWNENPEKNYCLRIHLHPFQNDVEQKKLIYAMELKAVRIVNEIGVDINTAYEFPHLKNTLMFVSGLGPRKAQHLLEKMSSYSGLAMRKNLVMSDFLEKKVMENANGFLKIKPEGRKKYELLDITRIPLDLYQMAYKIITVALENEKAKDTSTNTEKILRNPKRLERYDYGEYLRLIEENNNEKYSSQEIMSYIKFIVKELKAPFKDPRGRHKDLTPQEILRLFIGDDTFDKNQITVASIVKFGDSHIKCRLNNGLEATIWYKDIDNRALRKDEVAKRFKIGTTLEARIKEIDFNKFKVDLSIVPQVMRSHQDYVNVRELKHFKIDANEDYINRKYIDGNIGGGQSYFIRNIIDDHYMNLNYRGCLDYLSNREIGTAIFRPSKKGENHLTLSWKFYHGCISHVDVSEEGKTPNAAIGNKLIIGRETYESLDEIIARYVKPTVDLIKEITSNRKFKAFPSTHDVKLKLKKDNEDNPNIIHYYLTILPNYPQYVILAYFYEDQVTMEYIQVKPEGYYFHDQIFHKSEDIIFFFKNNFFGGEYKNYLRTMPIPAYSYFQPIEDSNINQNDFERQRNDHGRREFTKDKSNEECRYCHEKGHYAKECPKRNQEGKGSKDYGSRSKDYGPSKFMGNKREREEDGFKRGGFRDRGRDRGDRGNKNDNWAYGDKKENLREGNDRNEIQNENNQQPMDDDWGAPKEDQNQNQNDGWGNVDNENKNEKNDSDW
ncbi:MAG: hypothetical protein MJ252_09215 [archaeon]|nr:hypothetical protein [archaeon]